MGFLIGAFGKQMAGKRVRQLQARMMSVQSQLRRATRDIEKMEKYFSRVEKQNKMMMQQEMAGMMTMLQAGSEGQIWGKIAGQLGLSQEQAAALQQGGWKALQDSGIDTALVAQIYQEQNRELTLSQQSLQSVMQFQMQQLENEMEMQRELQLQPLKDLEDDLQREKDSLETQIQIAQADYEACKEMEKAGAKNLTPQYTGQG